MRDEGQGTRVKLWPNLTLVPCPSSLHALAPRRAMYDNVLKCRSDSLKGNRLTALQTPSQPDTSPLVSGVPPASSQDSYPIMAGAEPFLYEAGDVGCLLLHGYT